MVHNLSRGTNNVHPHFRIFYLFRVFFLYWNWFRIFRWLANWKYCNTFFIALSLFYAISIVCVPFPLGAWGRVWNSFVSIPDRWLLVYLLQQLKCLERKRSSKYVEMIRNWYNGIPHPTQDTKRQRKTNTKDGTKNHITSEKPRLQLLPSGVKSELHALYGIVKTGTFVLYVTFV